MPTCDHPCRKQFLIVFNIADNRNASRNGKTCKIKKVIFRYDQQQQLPEVFHKKSCSQKFRQIYRKTPVLESHFVKKLLTSSLYLC